MSIESDSNPQKTSSQNLKEEEEIKPIAKLQELRKQYPEVKEVQISPDIVNKSINKIRNASSFGQKFEGVIFGRETEKQLIISTLIPCSISESSTLYFSSYLDTSRLDNTKIGFFFCDEGNEFLSQNKLKTFIEFQKMFPNCVILAIDINAVKINTYPFKCFRISNKIMDKVEEEEIEENIYLSKDTIKEFYKQIFKKMKPTINMIEPLKLNIVSDIKNVFEEFAEKEYLDENDEDDPDSGNSLYYNLSKDVSFNMNRKIKELNKNCEKLIEEQRKYINYFKNKKINEIAKSKDDNKKRVKTSSSSHNKSALNEDKFDSIDFGLYSQNIKEMNKAIQDIITKKEINTFTSLNLV